MSFVGTPATTKSCHKYSRIKKVQEAVSLQMETFFWTKNIFCFLERRFKVRSTAGHQGCQISLYKIYQNGWKYTTLKLNYQMAVKYTKDCNILQMVTEYTSLFHIYVPKIYTQIWIFVWKYTIWQPCRPLADVIQVQFLASKGLAKRPFLYA
jgi:hypothetical protein